ncbi:MAG: sigma-70 family RNA polymerase sigma factor [Actinobacteria bacterium]|nr:sigma-70 family RNA polymerase sigma factor [Actinomycetota bacterium]
MGGKGKVSRQPGEESEETLLERIRTGGDARATERFVAKYEDLLHRFAHRYSSDRLPYEDAFQLAALGLMKALHRFDPRRGVSFITFAYPTIEGELKKHYRDHLELIRLPRPLRELRQRVMAAWRQMEQEGKEPDVAMLAERLGAGEEEIIEVLAAQRNSGMFSLDASRGEEGGETLGACVGAYDVAYEKVEEDVFIESAIAELPPRHRRIMELRLRRGWTQARIARELKVSQMHVSRIIREAVELLRRGCDLESDIA